MGSRRFAGLGKRDPHSIAKAVSLCYPSRNRTLEKIIHGNIPFFPSVSSKKPSSVSQMLSLPRLPR